MPGRAYFAVIGYETKYSLGVQLRYNYRLYPAPGQQQALADPNTAHRNFFASTHFAVLSDGRKVGKPRFLRRAVRKLRKAQQALSRKVTGSSNRASARIKVARVDVNVGRIASAAARHREVG